MEFDRIVITITQLEGGTYLVACQGEKDGLGDSGTETEITPLGQKRCDTKSSVIDFFVEKVEEQ